jgi:hypothetical protein
MVCLDTMSHGTHLDVVDRVDEARVLFDQPATDNADGASAAHARLVVAVDVGAHGQLGLLLAAVEQLADVGLVAKGIRAAAHSPAGMSMVEFLGSKLSA